MERHRQANTPVEAARLFGLGTPVLVRARRLSRHPQFEVWTGSGRVWMKRLPAVLHCHREIEREWRLVDWLARHEIPVPETVLTPAGRPFVLGQRAVWVASRAMAGRRLSPATTTERHVEGAALLLARFHNAGAGLIGDQVLHVRRDAVGTSEWLSGLERELRRAEALRAPWTAEVWRGLDALARVSPGVSGADSVVHGDFWEGNLRARGASISGVFDFEMARVDSTAYDLACALMYFARGLYRQRVWERRRTDWGAALAFIQWYGTSRRLTDTTLRQVGPMMIARIVSISRLWANETFARQPYAANSAKAHIALLGWVIQHHNEIGDVVASIPVSAHGVHGALRHEPIPHQGALAHEITH